MTNKQWQTLHDLAAVAVGKPRYIEWKVVDTLRKIGMVTFSWQKRGIVLTQAGRDALAAEAKLAPDGENLLS